MHIISRGTPLLQCRHHLVDTSKGLYAMSAVACHMWYALLTALPVACSVKEHSIALARSFEGPIVIIHSKGHVIPALANQHLAVLRAFLVSMQESTAALDSSGTQERQQQQMSTSLDPLDPPRPEWEAGQGRPRVPQQRASATSNSSQQQQDPVQHIVQPVSKVPSKL
eukprot:GHRR01021465.1.p1 GENE.GHRR01021465.1~~GHRR01021465.1.p1  ORF type:complete len:168 (+),score=43.08 GHRR01021465.1:399-902(+)